MYKVNKQKCIGCRVCLQNCPGATRIGSDGKAEIINQGRLKECGGEKVCPIGAIEKEEGKSKQEQEPSRSSSAPPAPSGTPAAFRRFGLGRGRGRGRGRGQGRGRENN